MKEKINKKIKDTICEIKGIKNKPQVTINYTFTDKLINEIKDQYKKIQNDNETENNELKQIKKLKNNKDIIIKPADKNLGTTIIEKEIYIKLFLI